MLCDPDYSQLLNLFIQLVESQNGREIQPGNEWLNDAQVLATKLFRHLASMRCLAVESIVEAQDMPNITYIDHASIQVVTRAALETYLVFFFVYGDPDRELSAFRHKIWYISGLADRQKYSTRLKNSHEILEKEKQEMEKIVVEIKASPYFATYTEKQRSQVLKGNWRTGHSWTNLGSNAGFHAGYFNNIYNYLCGYSHSSYASALQVGQAHSIDEQQMLARSILEIGVVLMSHFAFSYPTVFPDARSVLASNVVAQGIAEKWQFRAEDMDIYYDV